MDIGKIRELVGVGKNLNKPTHLVSEVLVKTQESDSQNCRFKNVTLWLFPQSSYSMIANTLKFFMRQIAMLIFKFIVEIYFQGQESGVLYPGFQRISELKI